MFTTRYNAECLWKQCLFERKNISNLRPQSLYVVWLRNRLNRRHSTHGELHVTLIIFQLWLCLPLIKGWLVPKDSFSKTKEKKPTTQCSMILSFHAAVCSCFLYNSNKVSRTWVCSTSRIQPHRATEVSIIRLQAHSHICFHLTLLLTPAIYIYRPEILQYAKACNARGRYDYTGGEQAL